MGLQQENRFYSDNCLYVWSGGCDSTLMIAEALDRYDTIETVSFTSQQLGASAQEKDARLKIIEHFRRKKKIIYNYDISIDFQVSQKEFGQATLWLTIVPNIIRDHQNVAFGYVRQDDWMLVRHKFREAYKNICEVCEKTSEITTPLFWHEKGAVIRELKERKLLSKVWYCDEPRILQSGRFKPCGFCKSCLTHKLGELDLALSNKLTLSKRPKQEYENLKPLCSPEKYKT